jgi:isopentenyl diphosphate isomerase/L-lactate dehydrogenase-like FMN-dependent dehydrogenase
MVPDIARLERRARALLSPEIYDFYAGGSGQESTLRANVEAWRRLWLMPRVLRDVSSVDTGLSLWGSGLRTPVAVAPTAFHRLAHGGRQLDRALPTALALAPVAAALRDEQTPSGRPAVLVDGGVRSGEDVLAAVASGAGAVFLGRPVLWALACGGAPAVRDLLTGLTEDLVHAMALAGAATLADLPGLAYPGDAPRTPPAGTSLPGSTPEPPPGGDAA